MKKFGLAVLAIAALLSASSAAKADPITGTIAMAGINNVTFNSTSVSFTNGGLAIASGSGGTLSNVSGFATVTGFSFANPDTSAAAPEPSSLLLLGTGLAGLALVVFRKAKSSTVTASK